MSAHSGRSGRVSYPGLERDWHRPDVDSSEGVIQQLSDLIWVFSA